MMVVARIVGIVVVMMVAMMIAVVVMIAVPRCGWASAAGRNYANDA
jgi:hypothetical protein